MKQTRKRLFQIDARDNVATALDELGAQEEAMLLGDAYAASIRVTEAIPKGHKAALKDIAPGEKIVKYGVVIGEATAAIPAGSWAHLHNIRSLYDERASHLDVHTGAPNDTLYI